MSSDSKRQLALKKKAKIRRGFECFGCGDRFTRRRHLNAHQGRLWPSCPLSIERDRELMSSIGFEIFPSVDNSVDKGIMGVK